MKTALLVLFAALVVLIPFRVRAGQTNQRVPISPGTNEGFRLGDGEIPSGYMILGDTEVSPPGYSFSGITLSLEPGQPDGPSWSTASPMLVARRELAAVAVNGKIYALGGFGSAHLASVEEYSEITDSWSFRASMPTPRSQLSAVVVDQKIYAIGGFDGGFLGTVEVYDPAQDSWSTGAPMPTPRRLHTMVVVSGRILAIGGHNGAALTTVEEYDPATDTWAVMPSLPASNSEGAAVLLNGIVYVTGGDNGWSPNSSTMAYDPAAATWTVLPGPSIYDHAVVVFGGSVFAFGGNTGGGTTSAAIQFGPTMATWTALPPMPTARQTLAAVAVGDRAYAIGGHNDAGAIFASVEVFGLPRRLYAHRRN